MQPRYIYGTVIEQYDHTCIRSRIHLVHSSTCILLVHNMYRKL